MKVIALCAECNSPVEVEDYEWTEADEVTVYVGTCRKCLADDWSV